MKRPIALQVYTVREAAERDLAATFARIAGMGYDGVELAGFYGHSAAEIRALADQNGLAVVSAHTPVDQLTGCLEQAVRDAQTLGQGYAAIPWLPEELRPGTPGFASLVQRLPEIVGTFAQAGIQLLYHNHDFELIPGEGGALPLDVLYQSVPQLQAELDVYWLKYAGLDPVAYVARYAARCPVLHLKDMEAGEERFFAPVGQGVQDVPGLIAAATGAKWLVVEQDNWREDPFACAEKSAAYLRSIGMGLRA